MPLLLGYSAPMRTYLAMLALAGCPGNDEPPRCIPVETACQPLYVPNFANVYNNTLDLGCGSDAVSCHSAQGRAGNMSFEDPATAHAALLAGRVIPGDASCSEMIVRAGSPGEDYQMPPGGDPLDERELCALVQWVDQGAPGVAP